MQTVGDIMSRTVETVAPGTPLRDVARAMAERSISCVLVCAGSAPTGIISERDLVRKVVSAGREPAELAARDVMTTPVVAVRDATTTLEALEVLRGRRFRRLPVVDAAGTLSGIVTQTDLVHGLLAFLRQNSIGDVVQSMMALGSRGEQHDAAIGTLTRRCRVLELRCAELLEFLQRAGRHLDDPSVDLPALASELADTTRAVEATLKSGAHEDPSLRDAVERAEASLRGFSARHSADLAAMTERVQRVESLIEEILRVAFPTAGTA